MHWDEHHITCLATSHTDPANPLRSDNCLPVQAGIEYAAQAVAAHGNLLARRSGHSSAPQQGMVAVLSNVHWHTDALDRYPGVLHIIASRVGELPGGLQYRFSVLAEPDALVEGEVLIALSSKPVA